MANLELGNAGSVALYLLVAACSSSSGGVNSGGMSSNSGGAQSAHGGSVSSMSGGASSSGGGFANGGAPSNGGTSTRGGAPSDGGIASRGGTSTSGGVSGSSGASSGGAGAAGSVSVSGGVGGAAGMAGADSGGAGQSNGGTGAAGNGGASAGGGGKLSGTAKIMPFGDSITAATCVRPELFKLLTAANIQFDFVGSRNGNGCSQAAPSGFDADNEGHSSYIAVNLLDTGPKPTRPSDESYSSSSADLARWFDSQSPDIVLMHFGTNDIWNGIAAEDILKAYSAVLAKLRTRNANVRLFVAQIIPLAPGTDKDYAGLVSNLNKAIPGWASSNSKPESPIVVVNQFEGFDVNADTSDKVHPNSGGAKKMAEKWFAAVKGLF